MAGRRSGARPPAPDRRCPTPRARRTSTPAGTAPPSPPPRQPRRSCAARDYAQLGGDGSQHVRHRPRGASLDEGGHSRARRPGTANDPVSSAIGRTRRRGARDGRAVRPGSDSFAVPAQHAAAEQAAIRSGLLAPVADARPLCRDAIDGTRQPGRPGCSRSVDKIVGTDGTRLLEPTTRHSRIVFAGVLVSAMAETTFTHGSSYRDQVPTIVARLSLPPGSVRAPSPVCARFAVLR